MICAPYSIIIPSRNLNNLQQCVAAVRRTGDDHPIIVIWDGEDANSEVCAALGGTAVVIRGDKPFSFARACNRGIQAVDDDDVVLLNDDALVTDDNLRILNTLHSMPWPDGGITAATTNVTGYPYQLPGNCRHVFRAVTFAAFVCVYIPRSTIDVVGLLDERFSGPGVYGGEDVDYCLRVRRAGLKVGVSDGCFVDHSILRSTFRGAAPGNSAPGDCRESNRIGREKWGELWPHK